MDYSKESIKVHKKYRGKLSIESAIPLDTTDDLAVAYTPGVAAVCKEIMDGADAQEFVTSKNTVAVITDGSAVLGLGHIGAVAGLPVMEGKAVLFKQFAGVNAFPIALDTQDVEEIITTIKHIAPTFGGINLEDISAPRCFEIEQRLAKELSIPVFHDDQHGTAIVVLAGLHNALRVVSKKKEEIKIVINGAGAAGTAIAKLLIEDGFPRAHIVDSGGVISQCRIDLGDAQKEVLDCCGVAEVCGNLDDVIDDADVFIGVSVAGALTKAHVQRMSTDAIIFAMANPIPEIMPEDARQAGARVVATGRSDFQNQINNVLVFPGFFKGLLESGVTEVTTAMKLESAYALAQLIENPTESRIIPDPFDTRAADTVAEAVRRASQKK